MEVNTSRRQQVVKGVGGGIGLRLVDVQRQRDLAPLDRGQFERQGTVETRISLLDAPHQARTVGVLYQPVEVDLGLSLAGY
ncbi:MAG TPA: hypothetical protein VG073_01375, partial [Gaiellaceae bacterium]|nr:hypothetical protein [Gaiellaceae bacterium]